MRIYSQDVVTGLIGRIYDTVLDPTQWSSFLEDVGSVVDGHGLNMSLIEPSHGTIMYGVHARSDPTFVKDYREYYSTIDPWLAEGKRLRLLRPGVIALGESIVPPNALKETEFYRDFGRHYRFCGGISAVFEVEGSVMGLSCCQYRFGQFNRSELELIQTLVPHLKRAVKIYKRLEGSGLTSTNASAVLEQVNCGVIFASSSGQLLFANRAAREILQMRDGVSVTRGELHASTPGQTTKLREAITLALSVRASAVTTDRPAVILQRPSGRRPLSILVSPLPRGSELIALDTRAVAMFVTDPERSFLPPLSTIRLLLGLTRSEAQLVQLLTAGRTVADAAEQLSIRVETARKRLKVIFQKTNTHRQSDLVRLVLLCMSGGTLA